MNIEPAWRVVPTLVMRSAGFPWQLVESLRHQRGAAVLDELITLEKAAAELTRQVPPGSRLSRGQQSKLRNLRPLAVPDSGPTEWIERWNQLTDQVVGLNTRLAEVTELDAADVTTAVEAIRADPRFGEAVACSSPPAYRDLGRGSKGARIRRQIASYAQRLAAKSETMSFFGPINYADLRRELGPSAVSWGGHQPLLAREAHTAARVLDALMDIAIDNDDVLATSVPRRTMLTGPMTGLLGEADGTRTVREIATAAGVPIPEAAAVVRAGTRARRVTIDLIPPASEVDPWGWLERRLGERADQEGFAELNTLVKTVRELLLAYPLAPPAEKLRVQAELDSLLETHQEGGRSRFYNDRVVIHEAAAGTVKMTVRGELAEDISAGVTPALDLLARQADLTRQRTNRALAEHLGARTVPLITVLREAADLPVQVDDGLTDLVADAVVVAGPGANTVDLRDHIADWATDVDAPILCSIDVLPAVADLADYRAGHTPLVLGDIHDAALLTPWALRFHPAQTAALAGRDAAVVAALGSHRAVNVISRRNTGLPPLEFPGVALELGGTVADPRRERVGLDALVVRSDGHQAVLLDRERPEEPLLFHNGELESGVHTALALPRVRRPVLPDLPYVPRLTVGNIVLARRAWTVPSDAVPRPGPKRGEEHRLLAMARFCAERGLPTRFFAKSPAERKPIFVDTATPALLDALVRLAGTTERLSVTEVLPTPEQAWLRDGPLRFAAELRVVYARPARTAL